MSDQEKRKLREEAYRSADPVSIRRLPVYPPIWTEVTQLVPGPLGTLLVSPTPL